MEKEPLTLFFMNDQVLRTERRWSLLLMQMHFLLICLAPLGLAFYAFLFYSASEPLPAFLAFAMLFPVALILRGMWRLHFWAYASLLFFIFMAVVYRCKKCSYKRIILSYKPDSPAKRIGAILSVLSFLYFLYRFILWCDYGGTEETESLFSAIVLFFACLSIVLGIPQRVFAWIKYGKI